MTGGKKSAPDIFSALGLPDDTSERHPEVGVPPDMPQMPARGHGAPPSAGRGPPPTPQPNPHLDDPYATARRGGMPPRPAAPPNPMPAQHGAAPATPVVDHAPVQRPPVGQRRKKNYRGLADVLEPDEAIPSELAADSSLDAKVDDLAAQLTDPAAASQSGAAMPDGLGGFVDPLTGPVGPPRGAPMPGATATPAPQLDFGIDEAATRPRPSPSAGFPRPATPRLPPPSRLGRGPAEVFASRDPGALARPRPAPVGAGNRDDPSTPLNDLLADLPGTHGETVIAPPPTAPQVSPLPPPPPSGSMSGPEFAASASFSGPHASASVSTSGPVATAMPDLLDDEPQVRRGNMTWAWISISVLLATGLGFVVYTQTDLFQGGDPIERRKAAAAAEAEADAEAAEALRGRGKEYGTLQVDTTPKGARVWLVKDGPEATFDRLPIGNEYMVFVDAPGHVPKVLLVKGRNLKNPVSIDLKPAPNPDAALSIPESRAPKLAEGGSKQGDETATLKLRTSTEGASLALLVGYTPGATLVDLDVSGTYNLRVTKFGHEPHHIQVKGRHWDEVDGGKLMYIEHATLKPKGAGGETPVVGVGGEPPPAPDPAEGADPPPAPDTPPPPPPSGEAPPPSAAPSGPAAP